MTRRVAIIGAGITGTLVAIGLARQGFDVDLIERNSEAVTEASFYNEGKIHLGFLYAYDRTWETPRLMIEGARTFGPIIRQLTGIDVSTMLSTPFFYAVHKDSLVPADAFERHLSKCCSTFSEVVRENAGAYVDGRDCVTARICEREEWEEFFDPATFTSFFATSERAVDPRRLAVALREALGAEERITWWPSLLVRRIHPQDDGTWMVTGTDGALVATGVYDLVVNATWSDLVRLDKQVGVPLLADWSYRYKLGSRVHRSVLPSELMSVTTVLGAFGDLVNLGDQGGIFVSWYPHGRLLFTDSMDLADWNRPDRLHVREAAYEKSRIAWEEMSPQFRALDVADDPVDIRGGVILASGRLDVDNPHSGLHSRLDVGIKQSGTYLSVNTGKYTLGPLMSQKVVARVKSILG
jgi:glycine/D-amino acid oxidase-like deaminating enzyme